jgi:enoyl-CoA hydratase/carnithine racemase
MLNIEIEGRIATLTIRRPERRNAISTELAQQLDEQLRELGARGDISAVVLTGEMPGFCAGSDLKELAGKNLDQMKEIEMAKGALISTIVNVAPPVIAAVEGFALGGGFVLAAACDFVVTSADARWHMPEAANGWIPPWGLDALKLRVGHFKARQLFYGLRLSGAEACGAGVADRVVAAGDTRGEAQRIARDLAALSPPVLATIKRHFGQNLGVQMQQSDAITAELFKNNCGNEPAIFTLSRFGVKNV